MCGIVGIVYRERHRRVPEGTIHAMCDVIAHRGPDDTGVFVRGPVGLGMRRLSIIDLAAGHQPIFNEDGTKLIVFNGEIYNYDSLRRNLIARGHRLTTRGDTETILHAYEDAGPECVQDLRGMFAFAIWDAAAETLVLARDRFGIKPLYYTNQPWGIAFASELKALRVLGLSSELDWDAVHTYFQLGYIPAPATPFRDVRKLPPGHYLVWRGGTLAQQRYWDLPLGAPPPRGPLEQRVLDWLDDSVRAHLVSDVPVAAFLSGGMDSSAVVASMAVVGAEPPHAFTARYHGTGAPAADETPLAGDLCRRYGARLTVVDVEPHVSDFFEPMVWALDEPHADESAVPSWLIAQRVAAEYKVALVGTGGDELFSGYRRHLGLLASDWYRHVPEQLRRLGAAGAGLLPEPGHGGLWLHRVKRFLQSGNGSVAGRYVDLSNRLPDTLAGQLFTPDLSAAISGNPARGQFEGLCSAAGDPRGLQAALYLDYKTYLPDDVLHVSDRMSMAHSLEVRVPFVDHVFVEHAFPIRAWDKLGFGRTKRILRRSLRSRLPDAHFHAPKRGFIGPTALWLRHELRDMLFDELAGDRLQRLGYFNPRTVRGLLDDHMSRRHNREGLLWALLVFSTWHRLYAETPAVADAGAS